MYTFDSMSLPREFGRIVQTLSRDGSDKGHIETHETQINHVLDLAHPLHWTRSWSRRPPKVRDSIGRNDMNINFFGQWDHSDHLLPQYCIAPGLLERNSSSSEHGSTPAVSHGTVQLSMYATYLSHPNT